MVLLSIIGVLAMISSVARPAIRSFSSCNAMSCSSAVSGAFCCGGVVVVSSLLYVMRSSGAFFGGVVSLEASAFFG